MLNFEYHTSKELLEKMKVWQNISQLGLGTYN